MERITDERFDEKVLDAENPVVVKFTASWCAPCRAYNPILWSAQKDHPHITFYEVDVEDDPDLASDYEVRTLPTTLIFKDGVVEGTAKGLITKPVLYAVLAKFGE